MIDNMYYESESSKEDVTSLTGDEPTELFITKLSQEITKLSSKIVTDYMNSIQKADTAINKAIDNA